MLIKYEPGGPARRGRSLLGRVGGAAREIVSRAPASAFAAATRSVEEIRAGRAEEVVNVIGTATVRIYADALDAAVRHEVPGAALTSQGLGAARQWFAPVAALATMAPQEAEQPRRLESGRKAESRKKDLRALGRDLLHRSAGFSSDDDEHPAFRTILSSLAPDEARIVRHLAVHGAVPMVDVFEFDRGARTACHLAYNVSFVGREAGCLRAEMAPVYLDHLARLGVVTIRDYPVAPEASYELLHAQEEIESLPPAKGMFTRRKIVHQGAELSDFGRAFYEVCFADVPAPTRPNPPALEASEPNDDRDGSAKR